MDPLKQLTYECAMRAIEELMQLGRFPIPTGSLLGAFQYTDSPCDYGTDEEKTYKKKAIDRLHKAMGTKP